MASIYGTKDWEVRRNEVLEEADYECKFCEMTNEEHLAEYSRELHAHHIVPREDGGSDDKTNLVALCQSCHRKFESIHAKRMEEVIRTQDRTSDLKALNHINEESENFTEEIHDDLIEFIQAHPIFTEHIEARVSDDGYVCCDKLDGVNDEEIDIDSEWMFATTYGYVTGIEAVLMGIRTHTDIPFDIPSEDD